MIMPLMKEQPDTAKDETSPPEIMALQHVINDKLIPAQMTIAKMSGRERALFAYYLRELGLMIEIADNASEMERRGLS